MKIGQITAPRAAPGFTLIEVLLSITIGAGLIAMMLVATTQALALWNRVGGNAAAATQARAVLDQVEADLVSGLSREDGDTWLAVDILTGTKNSGEWVSAANPKPPAQSLNLTSDSIADCRFGASGAWLRLFVGASFESEGTTKNDEPKGRGSVSAVAYQIIRRRITTSSTSELAYELYRSEVAPELTFMAGFDITGGAYATASAAPENGPGTLIRPNRNKVLSDHVVDFGVRFLVRDAGTLVPMFPASGNIWSNADLAFRLREGGALESTNRRPDVAEVMVRVLTEEGVRQLRVHENPPAGYSSTETWWSIVEKNSQVMTRRIPLHFSK